MLTIEIINGLSPLLKPSITGPFPSAAKLCIVIGALMVPLVMLFGRRVRRTILTFRALAVAPAMSRILSNWVKSRSYSEDDLLRADGANGQWVERRRKALDNLARELRTQSSKSIAWANELNESFSDLRFTDANRVPFPFMRVMRAKFPISSVMTASSGPHLRDLDGR